MTINTYELERLQDRVQWIEEQLESIDAQLLSHAFSMGKERLDALKQYRYQLQKELSSKQHRIQAVLHTTV